MWKISLYLCMLAVCLAQDLLDTSNTFCGSETSLQLVPADEGDDLQLLCQPCSLEPWSPGSPRVWYQRGAPAEEAPLTSDNDFVLVIKNFKPDKDPKIYGCRSSSEPSIKIEYFVDALVPANVSMVSGNTSTLATFEQEHLTPLAAAVQTELLATPYIQWGQRSLCKGCVAGSSGHRTSRGRCALRTSEENKFAHNVTELSCRSVSLNVTSELRAQLLGIPDFELVEQCGCPTPSASEGDNNRPVIFFLREGATWDIKCPYMEYPGAHVDWFREKQLILVRNMQPVDPQCRLWCKCGTLYVSTHTSELSVDHADRSIAGNFSCRAANHEWSFELRVYDVTGTCTFTRGTILLMVGLLLLPLVVTSCVLARLCCPEFGGTTLDSGRPAVAVILPVQMPAAVPSAPPTSTTPAPAPRSRPSSINPSAPVPDV